MRYNNHKSVNYSMPQSKDHQQITAMHRFKRVVSPDSMFFVPNDVNNIQNRGEQPSAVDAVVNSSNSVHTPQDAKRFKANHPEPLIMMNNNSIHNIDHAENRNNFYAYLYTHTNFAPYYAHYAKQRYEALNSFPSYDYSVDNNSSSYAHKQTDVPCIPSVLPSVENEDHIRRDTSLGTLCLRFLDRYEKLEENNLKSTSDNRSSAVSSLEVSIDCASTLLQVGRRRIYDIVNILESIGIVSRKCKSTYIWHGRGSMDETFRNLQIEAIAAYPEDAVQNGLVESVEDAINLAAHAATEPKEETAKKPANGLELLLASAVHMEGISSKPEEHESDQSEQSRKTSSKENSLGMTSQKFIQMFLLGNQTVELASMCEKIFGREEDVSDADHKRMIKTKIRRMYDIANVMTSLGFVRKATNKAHKSVFHWCYVKNAKELWCQEKF